EYVVKLSARLVFPDELYPEVSTAETTLALNATGSPQSGCATAGTGGLLGLLGLLGLGWVRRFRG
ncbi:MAG: hypothetical protein GYA21_09570, partial [Myxococcales bacterium]|nr:hypothetical protein [Myxococcales bacterium]